MVRTYWSDKTNFHLGNSHDLAVDDGHPYPFSVVATGMTWPSAQQQRYCD